MMKFAAWLNLFPRKVRPRSTRRCTRDWRPRARQLKRSRTKTRSWLKNVSKSFARKNALPLPSFSAGCGSVTRGRRGSLIFWNSAVFWVPAKARSRARFWSILTPPSSWHFHDVYRRSRQKSSGGEARAEPDPRRSGAPDQNPPITPGGDRGGRFFAISQPRVCKRLPAHLWEIFRCRCDAVSRSVRKLRERHSGRLLLSPGQSGAETGTDADHSQIDKSGVARSVRDRGGGSPHWFFVHEVDS